MSLPPTTTMPAMTTSQTYPSFPGTVDPNELGGEVDSGILSSEWYAPDSFTYAEPYITPFPSSTCESTQWVPSYIQSSLPDPALSAYSMPQHPQHTESVLSHAPGRPRSSPSTFGPSPDSIHWTTANPLGLYATGAVAAPAPLSSTFPANIFQQYTSTPEQYSTSSPPELRQPQPHRPYPTLAPNPVGVAAAKRRRDDEEEAGASASKRRKRTSSVASADLSEDDRYLVQLKEDEGLPWKDIVTRFGNDRGRNFQVAALQMRYKRLREKFRVWEEQDVNALRTAHEYWEKYKWEIISAKMLEVGVEERWPARHCARKWQDLEAAAALHPTPARLTPPVPSQFSSPDEAFAQFAFMPI